MLIIVLKYIYRSIVSLACAEEAEHRPGAVHDGVVHVPVLAVPTLGKRSQGLGHVLL